MKDVLSFESVTSTNDYLKENYQKLNHLTIVAADFQTKGRGQFLRTWESNSKENLLFSILLKNVKSDDVSLVQSIIVEMIISFFKFRQIPVYFKEPNDFYVDQKKIGGILIETKIKKSSCLYLIVGIGLNINQEDFENKNATSVYLLKKRKLNLILAKQHFFQKIRRTFNEIKQYLLET